ncbi:endonuclease [Flavobacterium urocaniciphilum]|uniref:Endonuclease I n=1 Tax=Flavobacterium urocaniciphilum TaxID=1299341 RepID=A0A1H9AEH7_9FLAO|nr:endonuclease [Flavobacterium urocaniciphilum]SEP75182.1 Endonuclease I [Flavobacterium urocaniciphilum]
MKNFILFFLYSVVSFSQIPAYYSGIDFTQTGNTLKNSLANLITTTHTNQLPYTSTSTDVWDALQAGDKNPNNATQVLLMYGYNDVDADYKNDRIDAVSNICSTTCPTGSWNREHCYALSLGTPALVTSSPGPGTDAHHIRAADVTFNADRGNRPYADGSGDAGPIGASNWYPGDEWKGDIARMMMYMYVRYNTRCLPTNVGSGSATYSTDMPNIFLEWNEEDPVSPFEKTRNDVLQSIQGNRNPFIDNPYLATLIWGGPQAPDAWNIIGCPSTTTWNGTSWNNGTPNKDIKAVFTGNYTSSGNLDMCSMDITGTAQVTLQTGHIFTVVRKINVASTANFTVQNNANLVQINNIANTGNITVFKNSANLLRLDYTAWSSPVSNQNLLAFSPQTLTNRFYTYNPAGTTTATAYVSINPTTNNFNPTTGYLIRSPNNWSASTSSPYIGQFTGIPNNGEYYTAMQLGYNLVGNPFPATIEGSHFIASNRTIETLYFWTHTAPASGGIYPINNFASYTTLGGVAAAAGGPIPDGSIKPGQGFYFYSSENENVFFHNALRYNVMNTQFFKSSNEKNLYRLNLSDNEKNYNQILIGYDEKATTDFDLGIDGKAFEYDEAMLFTTIKDEKYVIQGRPEFDSNDKVTLSFKIKNEGNYTLHLENKEGVFNSHPIYLKDSFNGTVVEISKNPYTFSSVAGTFTNRFELFYELENENVSNTSISALSQNTNILIRSSNEKISHVSIFDILGKKLIEKNFNAKEVQIENSKNNQVLLLEITLSDGTIEHQKIIH